MKSWSALVLVASVVAACGGTGTAPQSSPAASSPAALSSPAAKGLTKDITFRIGHVGSTTSLLEADAQDYVKRVDQQSGAKAKGRSYPAGQLGKQQEMVEQVQLGALEMVISSSEFVSVVPEFGIFDLPFAFRDRAEVKKAVEGPLGDELTKLAAKKNLVILGFWENGFRQITNNKRAIKTPDDLKGLKIRTPPNPDRVKMFQLWGANAAPLDFNELFSALQTGVFDGQENPLAQITSAKLHEVQKYLSMSGHVYTPTYLVASKTWYDGLEPAAHQPALCALDELGDRQTRHHYPRRSCLPVVRTSRAAWRSSKGRIRSAMIWYVSWPFPAITMVSPARAQASASWIASRRSGNTV